MKQHKITCPQCGRNLRTYNSAFLPAALESHMRREHSERPAQPADSSGIMSIGGVSIYAENEMPIIPSERAMARVEEMKARATYCRKCGQSDEFDGAMFTTGGGDICDDCF